MPIRANQTYVGKGGECNYGRGCFFCVPSVGAFFLFRFSLPLVSPELLILSPFSLLAGSYTLTSSTLSQNAYGKMTVKEKVKVVRSLPPQKKKNIIINNSKPVLLRNKRPRLLHPVLINQPACRPIGLAEYV